MDPAFDGDTESFDGEGVLSSSVKDAVSDISVGVPVTISASQSPRPPRAQSMAVCGLYTLMPSAASRRRLCCCEFCRVRLLSPRKIIGSTLC